MDVSAITRRLSHLHDLKLLGVDITVPDDLKNCKLSQAILEKYPQNFSLRCAQAALYLTYQHYKKMAEMTYQQFEAYVLPTPKGYAEFQKILQKVSETLPEKIPLKDLVAIQQIQTETETKV